jgi:DNA-binding IclR family transcriptional regulator
MPTISKALSILDLFDERHPIWTADEVMARLQVSQPTSYRYLRELCAYGYLVRLPMGYVLGPKIVELDYHIRQSDPVLRGAQMIMRDLANRTGFEVLLMSTFGDQIVTTHHEAGSETLTISFGRGHPMPLFRGAGSKAIVAFLPKAQRRRIYTRNAEEAKLANFGATYEEFEAKLQSVRRARFALSVGELNEGNVGIAAPIFQTSRTACGSLTVVASARAYETVDRDALIEAIRQAAKRISTDVMQSDAHPG